MALYCPKCQTRLSFWIDKRDKFPCPSCGTELKVTVRYPPLLWFFLPPILDLIYLITIGGFDPPVVHLADELPPQHPPSAQRVDIERLREAAEKGDLEAQFEIGREYEDNHNNGTDAIAWYQKAASRGHAEAQASLGRMYFTGRGTKRNYEEAFFWYNVAARSGKPKEWADALRRYLSARQIDAVEMRAKEWKPKEPPNSR